MKNVQFILFLAIIFACLNCSGGGDEIPSPTPTPIPVPEVKPEIELSSSSPVFKEEGGTTTVNFTCSADWSVDVTDGRSLSWCTVSPTSGSKGTHTLNIKTIANDTYDERNAKITIKAGDVAQTFTVSQKQKDGLIVTSNKVEVKAEGDVIIVEVKANVKFEYEVEKSAKEWILADDSRGLSVSTLKFKVVRNDAVSKREGKITISCGQLSETVTVYQEGLKPGIILTKNEYTVGSEGEDIKVELKSNVDYEIQMPKVDWISENKARTLSSSTHYFTILPNEGYDSRSTEILFVNKENNISEKITIKQMQKDAIVVAQNEYTIEAKGGNLELEVNSNVDFKVATSAEWIKQNTESRGLKTEKIIFVIAENQNETSREGLITLSSGQLIQEIKVIQKAKSVFSVSQTEFNLPVSGGEIRFTVSTKDEYTINWPKLNWLERTSKDNDTYVFKILENDEYDSRSADITIQNTKTEEIIVVKVLQDQKDIIVVGQKEYTVKAKGQTLEFNVETNVDFNIETSVDWINQNERSRGLVSKTLSFDIAENTNYNSREGVITISFGEFEQKVKVIQHARTVFSLSKTAFNFTISGGEFSIDVSSNGEYSITMPDVSWLEELATRSTSSTTHKFRVARNETYDVREAEILFIHNESEDTIRVKVTQDQIDAIVVVKDEYVIEVKGGFIDFEVKSNIEFNIETTVDWIKQNIGSRGLEATALSFTVVENTSKKTREGYIVISSGTLIQRIKVKQKGEYEHGGELDDFKNGETI